MDALLANEADHRFQTRGQEIFLRHLIRRDNMLIVHRTGTRLSVLVYSLLVTRYFLLA